MQTAVTVAASWARVALGAGGLPPCRIACATSTDVVGVEISGCTKNVVAIATGLPTGWASTPTPRRAHHPQAGRDHPAQQRQRTL